MDMTLLIITLSAVLLAYAFFLLCAYLYAQSQYKRENLRFYPMTPLISLQFLSQITVSVAKMGLWFLTPGAKTMGRDGQEVVLCIHGFHMNGSCFKSLRHRLSAHGYKSYAVDLGLPYKNPNDYADKLHSTLQSVYLADGKKIHLVAHSMGGLICRLLLKNYPDAHQYIGSIITLGTPHQGTAAVNRWSLPWLKKLFYKDSTFLKSLPVFTNEKFEFDSMCLASVNDLVVYPHPTALLDGSHKHFCYGVSHVGLLTDQRVFNKVRKWLDKNSAPKNT